MRKSHEWVLCIASVSLAAFVGAGPTAGQEPQERCIETPEGRVCTIEEPIVKGVRLVNPAWERTLGLVTLSDDCSGTLLNQFWVLTTDHCVAGGVRGGPPLAFGSVRISAAWTSQVAIPTRFVRSWYVGRNLDVALIYLGNGDLGAVHTQSTSSSRVNTSDTLTKFGRGIDAFAIPPNTPAHRDGQYRSAEFRPSIADANGYTLPVNNLGQVGNAGDSGGPDRIIIFPLSPTTGNIGAIVGVQSTCHVPPGGCLAGHSCSGDSTWVTAYDSCTSASLETISYDIIDTIRERPGNVIPCSAKSSGCGIVEISSRLLLK
jgi:hypothetical protein